MGLCSFFLVTHFMSMSLASATSWINSTIRERKARLNIQFCGTVLAVLDMCVVVCVLWCVCCGVCVVVCCGVCVVVCCSVCCVCCGVCGMLWYVAV